MSAASCCGADGEVAAGVDAAGVVAAGVVAVSVQIVYIAVSLTCMTLPWSCAGCKTTYASLNAISSL